MKDGPIIGFRYYRLSASSNHQKAISATKPIFVSVTLARLLGRTGAFPFMVGTRIGQCSGFSGVKVSIYWCISGRIFMIGN